MTSYTDAIHFAIHGARLLAQQKGELVHYVLSSQIGVKCRRFVTSTFDVVASDDGLALDIHRLENNNPVVMVDDHGHVYRTHGELRHILPDIVGEVTKFLFELSLCDPDRARAIRLESSAEMQRWENEAPNMLLRMRLPLVPNVDFTFAVPRKF